LRKEERSEDKVMGGISRFKRPVIECHRESGVPPYLYSTCTIGYQKWSIGSLNFRWTHQSPHLKILLACSILCQISSCHLERRSSEESILQRQWSSSLVWKVWENLTMKSLNIWSCSSSSSSRLFIASREKKNVIFALLNVLNDLSS
jgi:hypothetical protein